MPAQVLLKSNFDPLLRKTFEQLNLFQKELGNNRARRPERVRGELSIHSGTWSQDQVDDLRMLLEGVADLFNMVSQLAGNVRDD